MELDTSLHRSLFDPATQKRWTLECDGATAVVMQGMPGKEKRTPRSFDNAAAARAWSEKEIRSRLRKGYVLVNLAAGVGEPRMLSFLGGSYTGALAIACLGSDVLCNRHGPAHGAAQHDELVLVSDQAQQHTRLTLPSEQLIWQAEPMPAIGQVLLKIDHGVAAWHPDTNALTTLASAGRKPGSFLSTAGAMAAWYADGHIVVRSLDDGVEHFRRAVEPSMHGGHSPQMSGAVSAAGQLAYCAEQGVIHAIDLTEKAPAVTWSTDLALIARMRFSPDNRWLLTQEQYGHWRLQCLDALNGQVRPDWPVSARLDNSDFAFDATGARLAIGHRGKVTVYDFASMRVLLTFPVDLVVKRFALTWMGNDAIAVHTDLGCVGIYRVA